ncbi:hypothetical protein Pmar_PMAR004749 [Perkinsus marinus ATCC 50983]|uniref:Integrase catalytic domain-containing protein n=1 Tax=Perkinsus marinus (strain ATCC 50983 / TXsc) TaxID=423536 RepID=C5KF95_PERM5|nr:hypothetical protein Pmar_PMAR004749 [Perkinsus marinus ATCC 50983]EER16897.1 hypothetical protein Pmar_PMAR004749 [Perkinsus marinus ATCC 50983]|eukprot:XP_002785101.1 hypothetical protein Pmar_PMAR004749 [Perkinsus marinus ATCC 50983]
MNFSREPRTSPRLAQHRQLQEQVNEGPAPAANVAQQSYANPAFGGDPHRAPAPIADGSPPIPGPSAENGMQPVIRDHVASASSSALLRCPDARAGVNASLLTPVANEQASPQLSLHSADVPPSGNGSHQHSLSSMTFDRKPPPQDHPSPAYQVRYVSPDPHAKTPSPALPLRPKTDTQGQVEQRFDSSHVSAPAAMPAQPSVAQPASLNDNMAVLFQQFCEFMVARNSSPAALPNAESCRPFQVGISAVADQTAQFGTTSNERIVFADPKANTQAIERSILADIEDRKRSAAVDCWAQERSRMAASSAKGPPGGAWRGTADLTETRSLQDFLQEIEASSMLFKLGSDSFRFIYLFENLSTHVSTKLGLKLESTYGAIENIPYGRQYEAAVTALRSDYGELQGNDDSSILNRWYVLNSTNFPTYQLFEEEFTTILAQLRRRGHSLPVTQANGRLLAALPSAVRAWVEDHVPLSLDESEFQRRLRVHCINHSIGTGWSTLRPGPWVLDKNGRYVKKPQPRTGPEIVPTASNPAASTAARDGSWPPGTSPVGPPSNLSVPPPMPSTGSPQVLAATSGLGDKTSTVSMDGGSRTQQSSRDQRHGRGQKRPKLTCYRCRDQSGGHSVNDCPATSPSESDKRCAKCGLQRHATDGCDNRIVAAKIPCGRCLQTGHLAFICPMTKPKSVPLSGVQSSAALLADSASVMPATNVDLYECTESLGCIDSTPNGPGALSSSIKVVPGTGDASTSIAVTCLLDTGASCNFAQLSTANKLGHVMPLPSPKPFRVANKQTYYATQVVRLTVLTINSRIKLDFLVVPELTAPLVIGMQGLSALGMMIWISPGACSVRTGVGPLQWHQLQQGLARKRQLPAKKVAMTQTDDLLLTIDQLASADSVVPISPVDTHDVIPDALYGVFPSAAECLAGLSLIDGLQAEENPIISQAHDITFAKSDSPNLVGTSVPELSAHDLPYTELYPQGPSDLLVSVRDGPMVLKDGSLVKAKRMTMQLPFIRPDRHPPYRLKQLIRRDLALLNRLQQTGHLAIYESLIESFKKSRFIRPVSIDESGNGDDAYYMPHFPVFTASKTSPCRPVWCGNELSAYLCRGHISVVESTIVSSLVALRTSTYYATTDLSKAFYSLKIRSSDRRYQRFIYRGRAFEFAVVMMGLRPSPAMLIRAMRPIVSLAQYILTFLFGDPGVDIAEIDFGPLKVGPITRHFAIHSDFSSPSTALSWIRIFLDDVTITAKTSGARTLSLEVVRLVARIFGFICETDKESDDSSDDVVKHLGILIHHGSLISPYRVASLSSLPEVRFASLTEHELDERDRAHAHPDDFNHASAVSFCGFEDLSDLNITPRKIDSWLRQFFDPLGLWLELVLRGRLLYRRICSSVVSPDAVVRDTSILTDLVGLYRALTHVPRVNRLVQGPLFITVDASKEIIAAVVCDKRGTRLFARAQVIPAARLSWTIVRQELTAILLGIEVGDFLSKLGVMVQYLCTDSLINLARCSARKFRTKGLQAWEILNIHKAREGCVRLGLSIHHIPGRINPADGPSRARIINLTPDLAEERLQYFEDLLREPHRPLEFWSAGHIVPDIPDGPEDVELAAATTTSLGDGVSSTVPPVPEGFSNELLLKIRSAQPDDPLCKNVCRAFTGNCPDLEASYVRNLKRFFHISDDGLILRTIEAPDGRPTIVVPAVLATEVVEAVHVCARHPGRDRTRQLVARHFWCKGLYKLTNRIVCSCDTCNRIKSTRLHRHSLGEARVRSSLPGELLGVDLLVYNSIPDSSGITPWSAEVDTALQTTGNTPSELMSDRLPKYILMIVCAATYRIWTRTLCTKSAPEVATVLGELLDDISPSVCLVDGGKEFANLLVRSMFVARGIQLLVVPPYSPRLAFYERCHREYQNGLRSMLLETNSPASHWWKYHSLITHAYNNSPLPGSSLSAAAVTPNDLYLAKGSTALLPGGTSDRPLSPAAERFIEAFEAIPPSELASKVNNSVAQAAAAIRDSLGVSMKLYQANWELRRAASRKGWALASVGRRSGPIEPGTWVYVWRPAHYKVTTNWIGPARVMAVRPADTYLIYWIGNRDDGADGRSSTEAGYNLMPIRQAAVLADLNVRYNNILVRAAAVQRAFIARQQIVRQQPLPTPQDILNSAAPNSLLGAMRR